MRTICLIMVLVLAGCGSNGKPAADAERDEAAVRAVVARYLQSVEGADTALARQVWAEREDLSFIHPLGHERGWEQIRSNVYEKLMGGMFATRKLESERMDVQLMGDAAVVAFYWKFDATWRKDGKPFHSEGRETQVMARDAAGAWRIVHVHYSGMPAAPPGPGL